MQLCTQKYTTSRQRGGAFAPPLPPLNPPLHLFMRYYVKHETPNNCQKHAHSLFEELLKSIAQGHIFERLRYRFKNMFLLWRFLYKHKNDYTVVAGSKLRMVRPFAHKVRSTIKNFPPYYTCIVRHTTHLTIGIGHIDLLFSSQTSASKLQCNLC